MGKVRAIKLTALDELTAKLIQRLPRNHRLQNFRSDIPAWLEETDRSVTTAKCNKFARSAHILRNFGIHTEVTFTTYHRTLIQSCGKTKHNAQAAHNEAKILHFTRNPLPIGDIIHAMINSRNNRDNTDMVAALRASEHIAGDLLEINRICTWVYWTAMQQLKKLAEKLPKE